MTFLEALKKETGASHEIAQGFIQMMKSEKWQDEFQMWAIESFSEYEREKAA